MIFKYYFFYYIIFFILKMSDFINYIQILAYDENNNLLNIFDNLKFEYLHYTGYYHNNYFNGPVPKIDVYTIFPDYLYNFIKFSFIKKVCYILNIIIFHKKQINRNNINKDINDKINQINKIKFIDVNNNKNNFIIKKIKDLFYNINYNENDKNIINTNIFLMESYYLMNFNDHNETRFKYFLLLGDYIYELIENKEYFNGLISLDYENYQRQELNYKKMVLEKDTIIEDLKNKCNFINEITNINNTILNSFNELKDKYNKLIDERNNFVEDEIKKHSNNLNNLLFNKSENERLKDENKKLNELLEINKKDNKNNIKELNNKINELNKTNDNNKKELNELQNIYKQLEDENKKLKDNIKNLEDKNKDYNEIVNKNILLEQQNNMFKLKNNEIDTSTLLNKTNQDKINKLTKDNNKLEDNIKFKDKKILELNNQIKYLQEKYDKIKQIQLILNEEK